MHHIAAQDAANYDNVTEDELHLVITLRKKRMAENDPHAWPLLKFTDKAPSLNTFNLCPRDYLNRLPFAMPDHDKSPLNAKHLLGSPASNVE